MVGQDLRKFLATGMLPSVITQPQCIVFQDLSRQQLSCSVICGTVHDPVQCNQQSLLGSTSPPFFSDTYDCVAKNMKQERLVITIVATNHQFHSSFISHVPQARYHCDSVSGDSTSTCSDNEEGTVSNAEESHLICLQRRVQSPSIDSDSCRSVPQRVESSNEPLVDSIPPEKLSILNSLAHALRVSVEDIYICEGSPRTLVCESAPLFDSSPASRSSQRRRNRRKSRGTKLQKQTRITPPELAAESVITKTQLIASGYTSSIYEVTVDGWTCAMKEVGLNRMEECSLRRCEQELEVMRTVPHHPNICHYLGSRRQGNYLQIFLTKYSTNLTLKLRDMRHNDELFTPTEVVRIALDVIRGVRVLV